MAYADLCASGLLVTGTAVEDGGTPVVQFGADRPLPVPTWVRNLRVAPSGSFCAFKGQDGTAYTVTVAGSVESHGPAYGDESVAIAPSGRVVIVSSVTTYTVSGVDYDLPVHRRGTSQGILDVLEDGSIRWVDDCFSTPRNQRTFGPLEFVTWRTLGRYTFGNSQQGAAVWDAVDQRAYVLPPTGTPWTLRGAVVNGVLRIATSLPARVIQPHEWTPYAAPVVVLPPPVVVQPPVAPPPVAPPEVWPSPGNPPVEATPAPEPEQRTERRMYGNQPVWLTPTQAAAIDKIRGGQ